MHDAPPSQEELVRNGIRKLNGYSRRRSSTSAHRMLENVFLSTDVAVNRFLNLDMP